MWVTYPVALSSQLCKCLRCFLTQVMADHESVASDKFFILLEKSRGYSLEPHVFKAPTKVWKEELQRGTILEEQPSNDPHEKTFVVADRKEVHFDCEVIRLAGNLEKLTIETTKQLLKVTSPEIRYQSYLHQRRRVAEQRQEEEGRVSLCNDLLIVVNHY